MLTIDQWRELLDELAHIQGGDSILLWGTMSEGEADGIRQVLSQYRERARQFEARARDLEARNREVVEWCKRGLERGAERETLERIVETDYPPGYIQEGG